MATERGRLLGLTGPAGAGKSTMAKGLIADGSAALLHFAGPLKAMLRAIGLTDEDVTGSRREHPHPMLCGRSVRYAAQTLGTDWGREMIGRDVWVSLVMRDVDRLLEHGVDVVLDDVRFDDEAQAIIDRGGVVLRLIGRGSSLAAARPRWRRLVDWCRSQGASHPSERGVDRHLIHAVVCNTGPVDENLARVRWAWSEAERLLALNG